MIMPSLSALFAYSTGQIFSYKAPILRAVFSNKADDQFVLFFCLNKIRKYPWAFNEFGVQNLLPSVEALDVSSLLEKSGNAFPISGSVLIYELLQFLVFFLGPPSLLDVLIFLGVVMIHHLQFGDDVIYQIFTSIRLFGPFFAGIFCTFLFKMFESTFQHLFFEGFEALCGLSQFFVIY